MESIKHHCATLIIYPTTARRDLIIVVLMLTSLLAYIKWDDMSGSWRDVLAEPQTYPCDDVNYGRQVLHKLQRRYEAGACTAVVRHAYKPSGHVAGTGSSERPWPIGGQQSRDNVTSPASSSSVVLHMPVCGRHFTFSHYVTVKSAVLALKPRLVLLYTTRHYSRYPYHVEWLDRVYDLATRVTVTVSDVLECSGRSAANMYSVITSVAMRQPHALNVFMQGDIIFGDSTLGNTLSRKRVPFDTIVIVNDHSGVSLQSKLQTDATVGFVSCPLLNNVSSPLDVLCNGCMRIGSCYRLHDDVSPRSIVAQSSDLSSLIRQVAYGSSDVICPVKYANDVIPRVGHYTWFNRPYIDFSFYLSVLSLLYVAGVECVVVHGNLPASGPFWRDLQSRACVKWHYWPFADHVYGSPADMFVAHRADITRAEIIARYGGLNVDPDVYFVNPLPDHIWSYEAVISLDAFPGHNAFTEGMPDSVGAIVNLGVCMGAPGARYFRFYQDTQRSYVDRVWLYNSGIKPSEVYDLHPDLALLVPNLQVPCFKGVCEAGWARDERQFSDILQHQHCVLNTAYALHFTWPDPEIFEDPSKMQANGSTAYDKVAAIILTRAGISIQHVQSLQAAVDAANSARALNVLPLTWLILVRLLTTLL